MKKSGGNIFDGVKKRIGMLKTKLQRDSDIKRATSKLISNIQRITLKTENLKSMFKDTGSTDPEEEMFASEQIKIIQKCQDIQNLCEEMSKKFKDNKEPFIDTLQLWNGLKEDGNVATAFAVCNIPSETLEEITFEEGKQEEKQRKINSRACWKISQQARENKRQYKKAFAEYVKIVKKGVILQKTMTNAGDTVKSILENDDLISQENALKPIKKICDTSIKKCKKLTVSRAKHINWYAESLYTIPKHEGKAISYKMPYDDIASDGIYCELNI